MKIIIALLIFGLIIIIHELGHFLLAKINGIYVYEFSVGMGPRIFSFQKGETRYSLKLLPFGGSCMMMGEDEASDDERSFGNKSVLARISVVFAGPFFNFILAFVLSIILVGIVGFDKPVITQLVENGGAEQAGIQVGDEVIKINNSRIGSSREISLYTSFEHKGETVTFTVKRDGQKQKIQVTPQYSEQDGRYYFGIYGSGRTNQGFLDTIKNSFLEVRYWIKMTFVSIKELILGNVSVNQMSGPVGIVNYIGDTYDVAKSYGVKTVVSSLLNIAILLTANLGVMNLLPIPALDGGRLVFLVIEGIRRKKISPEKEGMVHFIGFALLMILMVVVMFNDIKNIFV